MCIISDVADFRMALAALKLRLGMYVPSENYQDTSLFICGMDFATGGAFLKDINEWLRTTHNIRSPFSWNIVIAEIYESGNSGAGILMPEIVTKSSAAKVEFLFSTLDRFLESIEQS